MRIVILGDSTVCDFDLDSPLRGWGQVIGEWFTAKVEFLNLARSGASTKTFNKDGRLDRALREGADFALIQFGHNDSHASHKPESTDADGEFADNLREFVNRFRASGTAASSSSPRTRALMKSPASTSRSSSTICCATRAAA